MMLEQERVGASQVLMGEVLAEPRVRGIFQMSSRAISFRLSAAKSVYQVTV